jgi:RNA polymerase sigma factor (sigma-70 family)
LGYNRRPGHVFFGDLRASPAWHVARQSKHVVAMDDHRGSVSCWIDALEAGDEAAAQKLWERYFRRLAGLARKKLGAFPRRVIDEEDIVQSAFQSFCQRASEGKFPRLADRDDLWRLLAVITARKAANQMAHLGRVKRGDRRVVGESVLGDGDESPGVGQVIGHEPTPEFAAQIVEQIERVMALLDDPTLRVVVLWKLEGRTNPEISQHLDCSLSAVERKLRIIRQRVQNELAADCTDGVDLRQP